MCGTDCFLMLLAVLFPPIGVWVKRGVCSADSLINLALCCLGFLPGLLHAWYIILQNPDPYQYEGLPDGERQQQDGSVTYYYITREGQRRNAPPRQGGATNYGTVGSQPTEGQFPGQQAGGANAFTAPKMDAKAKSGPQVGQRAQNGARQGAQGGPSYAQVAAPGPNDAQSGEGSGQPEGNPPTYADVIKGDHKVQKP